MVNVNVDNQVKKRTSKGKQKIDIKKIDKKSARQVAFTKRRHGLFSKCSKLASDFGSHFAFVTFSEAGKPFVSGYPTADAVIERFVNDPRNKVIVEATTTTTSSASCWWDVSVDGMSLDELERFKVALQGFKNDVVSRSDPRNNHVGVQETAGIIDFDSKDAINGAEYTDSCIDIDEIISSVDQVNDMKLIDFGCGDDGVYLSDLIGNAESKKSSDDVQESTVRFEFGCNEDGVYLSDLIDNLGSKNSFCDVEICEEPCFCGK